MVNHSTTLGIIKYLAIKIGLNMIDTIILVNRVPKNVVIPNSINTFSLVCSSLYLLIIAMVIRINNIIEKIFI